MKTLFIGSVGTIALAPVLAIPVLFAAVTLERWTRATAAGAPARRISDARE